MATPSPAPPSASATPTPLSAHTFAVTGATSHQQTITGLTNGGSYTYYVACSSTDGGASITQSRTWTVSNTVPINKIVPDGSAIQSVTSADCTNATVFNGANTEVISRVYDSRDQHSYYIAKLADNKCWMLTNLAYAGGGTDTYGDVKSITYWDRSSAFFGGSLVNAYTLPYFTDTGSGKDSAVSYTIEPTSPSLTSGSGGQYGYLYNWCAAMGGQSGACTDLNTAPKGYDATVSICPANWRLPTGGTNREFVALNKAVNSGSKNSDAGLRSRWRGVYSGRYYNGSIYKNSYAHYWSSNAYTTHGASSVFSLFIDVRSSEPENFGNRYDGFAMRCIR